MVDDGSKDETARKACDISRADDRVSVITIDNAGPAAARNRGIESASGKYLAFVDADDIALPDAYSTMVDSLERTGSDIATGSYVRIGSTGRTRPKVTARVHERQRLAVRLDDMPELLEEPVLWNKVYRRDFWNRHVGQMTSFANYEDQEPVYRALVGAAAIDVLTKDVYAWRLADGRNTRSRRKAKLTDLNAKLEVIEALAHTLEHEPEGVREHAYAIWVGTDLGMHAEYLDTASKRFRNTLCTAAHDLKKAMPRGAWKLIPAQMRLLMWVVATGRISDIEEILGTWAEETTAVPLEHVEGNWVVSPSYVARLTTKLPPRLLKAQLIDLRPVAVVRNARWVDDRKIELQGCAYIPGIDPSVLKVRMRGTMDGATVFDLPVEPRNDNRVDLDTGDPWRSYETGGFRIRLDISDLGDLSPRGIDLVGSFETYDVHLCSPATSTTVVGMIAPSPILGSERLTVVADDHDRLSIRPVIMPRTQVVAERVTLRGESITLTLMGQPQIRTLELVHQDLVIRLTAENKSDFTGYLPSPPDQYEAGGERIWKARAQLSDGTTTDVFHEVIDYLLPKTDRVRPEPNMAGRVWLSQRFKRVSITGASSDRDRLLLTGRIDPPERLSVVLKSSSQTIAPVLFSMHADGSFTAVYKLTKTGTEGGTIAAVSGGYYVRFGESFDSSNGWARVAEKLAVRPVDCFAEWNTLRIEGRSSSAVAITASPPWSPRERTKYGRFQLRKQEWGPLTKAIVFESYNGKSANDNPRAIFDAIVAERPDIPLYWSVQDRRVDVPEGGIPIVEGTKAWYKALATSRVWINNSNFPHYVSKRPGQFYLQTWHGTPIKKLLWDIPRRRTSLTYRRTMKRQVPQWDLLLAQSESASRNLCTGLGYAGDVQVMEAPRNTRIGALENSTSSIRSRLGLRQSDKVVLFAPTWRERHRKGKTMRWDEFIDPQDLADETGTKVMVRAHHVSTVNPMESHNVLDVSTEPHVESLLVAADILVTDYSSIAYDFELLKRPIVLFVPDLSAYKTERGLYSAFPRRAVVTDSIPELVAAVQGLHVAANSDRAFNSSYSDLNVLIDRLIKLACEQQD